MIRTYEELSKLPDYDLRLKYLRLNSSIGMETFGDERYLNQMLYRSALWKRARDVVIIRDAGCDLGLEGFEIEDKIIVHHMNPITVEDVLERRRIVFDPAFLISCSFETHNAIHYGTKSTLSEIPIVRSQNDTCPWK